MTLWKLLKLQNRRPSSFQRQWIFCFGNQGFQNTRCGEPLCLPKTLRYFSLRERIVAAVRLSGQRSPWGLLLVMQRRHSLKWSTVLCSPLFWSADVSAARGACRTSQPVELITEPFHLWYSKADLLRKDFVWWFCSLEKVWFFEASVCGSGVYGNSCGPLYFFLTVSVLRCWKKGVWRRLVSTLSDSFLKILMKKTEKA